MKILWWPRVCRVFDFSSATMSNYNLIFVQSKPVLESSRDLLEFGLVLGVLKRDLDASNAVQYPIKLAAKLS